MTPRLPIAPRLRRAQQLLQTGPWVQGLLHDDVTGGSCLIGALQLAWCDHEAERYVLQACLEQDPAGHFLTYAPTESMATVARWNDYPGRTKAEVLQVLTRAIQLAEAREAPLGDPDAVGRPEQAPLLELVEV